MTTFSGTILNELKPTIEKMVKKISDWQEKETGAKTTPRDLEYFELMMTYDMLKAIGNHTKSDDKLISIHSSTSLKGNIEINAIISRDNLEYRFNTEAIYAGGYNIQRLHYRYITFFFFFFFFFFFSPG